MLFHCCFRAALACLECNFGLFGLQFATFLCTVKFGLSYADNNNR